jgi:hypothetical protein
MRVDHFNNKVKLNSIYTFSPYRAVNTLRLRYKRQSLNSVQKRHFVWDPYKTRKWGAERSIFGGISPLPGFDHPDHSARSESLYRLSYRGPEKKTDIIQKIRLRKFVLSSVERKYLHVNDVNGKYINLNFTNLNGNSMYLITAVTGNDDESLVLSASTRRNCYDLSPTGNNGRVN